MRRQQRITISRAGWYYLACMAVMLCGALLRQINLLMLLYGLMTGPLLLSWLVVRRTVRNLSVTRKLPRAAVAGEAFSVEISAQARRGAAGVWSVNVEDAVSPTQGHQHKLRATTYFDYVPPQDTRVLSYRCRLMRRGRYQFGPLRLTSKFPFGLLRCVTVRAATQDLLVLPRLGRLGRNWSRRSTAESPGLGRVRRRQGTLEGDFYGLREWRSQDNRSWIHWRTSARRGSLMVRQFEQQRTQNLCLIVELRQAAKPTEEEQDLVELAVSFAGTVAAEACRSAGAHLWLSIAARQPQRLHGPMCPLLLHQALEALAVAEADGADHLPEMLDEALAELPGDTRVVLVSSRDVSLTDRARFGRLTSDPRRQPWLSRIICRSANDGRFNDVFLPPTDVEQEAE